MSLLLVLTLETKLMTGLSETLKELGPFYITRHPVTCIVTMHSWGRIRWCYYTANSAFSPSGVSKWGQVSTGKANTGSLWFILLADEHGVCTVQVKLWDPLRTRAIPEHLRDVFTTRRYTKCVYLTLPYDIKCITRRIDGERFMYFGPPSVIATSVGMCIAKPAVILSRKWKQK